MSYTPQMLDHFNNPRNAGELKDPTAVGSDGKPGQGNYMIVHIRVDSGRISKTAFQTYGCPGAIACGSAVTELAKGRRLKEALGITRDDIDGFLGGLPLGKGHCADLAAQALQEALRNALGKENTG